jgi:D-3-phosphoglycerate dehydrogenase
MGVELMSLEELLGVSHFVTIHLPRTPETIGLLGEEMLALARPGLRIVNTARGGILDEEALDAAIRSGRVAGAALDVFAKEPTTKSPLFALDSVVVTPHLGASTREAQDKAGETIAEQVLLALSGGFVPYAVNVSATEASETVRPFLPLAERLGRLFASLNDGVTDTLEIEYQGHLADYDTRILTLAVLKGLLGAGSEEPVSYVNAPTLAAERGVVVRESKTSEAKEYVNLISLRGGDHGLAGTLFGLRDEARLVLVDDHTVDIPPSSNMVVVRNDDRPGMIGVVGVTVGRAGINISDMDVGVSPSGEAALMVLSTDRPLPVEVLDDLRSQPGILQVHAVSSG